MNTTSQQSSNANFLKIFVLTEGRFLGIVISPSGGNSHTRADQDVSSVLQLGTTLMGQPDNSSWPTC